MAALFADLLTGFPALGHGDATMPVRGAAARSLRRRGDRLLRRRPLGCLELCGGKAGEARVLRRYCVLDGRLGACAEQHAGVDRGAARFRRALDETNALSEIRRLRRALAGQRRESLEIFTKVYWPTGTGKTLGIRPIAEEIVRGLSESADQSASTSSWVPGRLSVPFLTRRM